MVGEFRASRAILILFKNSIKIDGKIYIEKEVKKVIPFNLGFFFWDLGFGESE